MTCDLVKTSRLRQQLGDEVAESDALIKERDDLAQRAQALEARVKRSDEALKVLQEVTTSNNLENPWLGVVAAVTLMDINLRNEAQRADRLQAEVDELEHRVYRIHPEQGDLVAETWQETFETAKRDEKVLRDLISTQDQQLTELRALADRLKLEAEIQAQEARSQRATVHEIYQLVTGATGEPGDWNGAEPVRKALANQRTVIAGLVGALHLANQLLGDKIRQQTPAWRDRREVVIREIEAALAQANAAIANGEKYTGYNRIDQTNPDPPRDV